MIELNNIIKNDIKSNVQNFEYLVNIDDKIFVATRKQMLQVGSDSVFYEDVGIKVSNIGEKIDLKDKKTQLSSVSISFQNFSKIKDNSEGRFSDEFIDMVGKRVKIYFKTQSCKTLDECLLVSQVKITRVTHDSKQIQISCNDLGVDKLLKDIPSSENILVKGINTFDHYSLKPVPILYGHLESAPAVVYKEQDGDGAIKVLLLPDTSYLRGGDIGGVSKFETIGTSTFMGIDGIYTEYLQMARQNVVQVGIGDHLCDVPCLPYQQTRDKIKSINFNSDFNVHAWPQWHSRGNHVKLSVDSESNTDQIEKSAMWLSINEKPIAEETMVYEIKSTTSSGTSGGDFKGFYEYGYDKTEMENVTDSYTSGGNPRYRVGLQKFKFKPLSGYDLNEEKDDDGNILAKSDVHFIGSLALYQTSNLGYRSSHRDTLIHAVYASPFHDTSAVDSDSRIKHVGYPTSLSNNMTGGTADDNNFDSKWRRTSIMAVGNYDYGEDVDEMRSFRTSFISSRYNFDAYNSFTNQYSQNAKTKYPTLDASVLSLYYFVNDVSNISSNPKTNVHIRANWRDLQMRRVWSNKNIFEKDFFVNARGKLGGYNLGVKDIGGHIVVKYGEHDLPNFDNNSIGDRELADNLHFTELYKYCTDKEYKTKNINGNIYDIVLVYESQNGEMSYVYDVDVENLSFHDGSSGNLLPNVWGDSDNFIVDSSNVSHMAGWIIQFSGKFYGTSEGNLTGRESLRGVRLAYARKEYDGQDLSGFALAENEDMEELSLFNDNNGYNFGQTDEEYVVRGYTSVSWGEESESRKLIERPHEIVGHLLTGQEANINFDEDKINEIYAEMPEYKLAFSINEKENTNDIIQKICQQSTIYYRYRGRDEKVVLDVIKATYSDDDVNGIISVDNMKNFSFKKTKIEDSCFGGVVVNYAYNYSTKNFDKRTAKRDAGVLRSAYATMYGIDGVEGLADYEVELDAPYIQDEATAKYFRDYYFELHKQPKLVCKFDLPSNEGLSYEVGDIIRFNKDPNNTAPYGRAITSQHEVLEQIVTPYFFITNTQKSLFKVSIECVQIHEANLNLPEVTLLGDINLDGQITMDEDDPSSDINLLLDMVLNGTQSYTTQQLLNADVDGNGIIDINDFIRLVEIYGDE